MTIDRRIAYYRRALKPLDANPAAFNERLRRGYQTKDALKNHWHLIDQGKTQ